MALPFTVPYTFATATGSIPLSQLDNNFSTVVQAVNAVGNGANSLSNVTITGGTITNVTITSLVGPVAVNSGGTGQSSLTANNVLLGNGTNSVQTVSPGSTGNVLTSTGSSWISQSVSSIVATATTEYTANTTWNKANVSSACTMALIECWGGGGGGRGGIAGSLGGAGGGGGGYASLIVPLSKLSNTVAITVGVGGSGSQNVAAGNGTNTSFGSLLIAYGGTGARSNTTSGFGGSCLAAPTPGDPGFPDGGGGSGPASASGPFGGGGGSDAASAAAGLAINGGGGGGWANATIAVAGGTSSGGGAGGNGSTGNVGGAGSLPGGGGGGCNNGTGGAGGNGLVRITVW